MPDTNVNSLKKENESLKSEIAALKKNFEDFQNSLKLSVNDANVSNNGGDGSRPAISQDETLNTLQFYAGVEISIQDTDMVHRIPTRNATSSLRPVVCKFTRRIAKEKVMNVRKDACKVTASSIGLPADCTLENVKLFDHLTPQVQQLLADTKKFQTRNGFRFC